MTAKWTSFPTPRKGLLWYFENEFAPARLARTTKHTRYRYVSALAQFDMFLGRAATLADLNDKNVAGAGAWLVNEKGLSVGTEAKFRDCLTCLWRFLHGQRFVDKLPALDKLRPPQRIPCAWKPDELKRLWEYLTRMPGELAGVPANLWFMSLHATLWSTGERIGALLQTKWCDVDIDGGWITVRAEGRKGKLSDKLSRLHPETAELLRAIVLPQRELVWPWPYCHHRLWQVYRDIIRRAGLPNGRMNGFHKMRKSVATYTKLHGGNAQEVLGHWSPTLTEAVYIDPTLCPKQHAADVLPMIWRVGEEGRKDASA